MEEITSHGKIIAIILRASFRSQGVTFLTPDNFTQQLGYMSHPKGHVVTPHLHNSVPREVEFTKEVLLIKSGKVRVDFYDDGKNYLQSRVLYPGDVILLAYGGHGFEMLESSEIIEVKQGPYVGVIDKTRFPPVCLSEVRIEGEQ